MPVRRLSEFLSLPLNCRCIFSPGRDWEKKAGGGRTQACVASGGPRRHPVSGFAPATCPQQRLFQASEDLRPSGEGRGPQGSRRAPSCESANGFETEHSYLHKARVVAPGNVGTSTYVRTHGRAHSPHSEDSSLVTRKPVAGCFHYWGNGRSRLKDGHGTFSLHGLCHVLIFGALCTGPARR